MHVYEQARGRWTTPEGIVGMGYSGNGIWKNNPDCQSVEGHGPLPRGSYTIGPAHSDLKLGPCVMALTPDATNTMFGRSAFFVHGDDIAHPGDGSDGCIVMPPEFRENMIATSSDRRLQVV